MRRIKRSDRERGEGGAGGLLISPTSSLFYFTLPYPSFTEITYISYHQSKLKFTLTNPTVCC